MGEPTSEAAAVVTENLFTYLTVLDNGPSYTRLQFFSVKSCFWESWHICVLELLRLANTWWCDEVGNNAALVKPRSVKLRTKLAPLKQTFPDLYPNALNRSMMILYKIWFQTTFSTILFLVVLDVTFHEIWSPLTKSASSQAHDSNQPMTSVYFSRMSAILPASLEGTRNIWISSKFSLKNTCIR